MLYEIGYINPSLIIKYTDSFLELTKDKNNRMVWGSMIALWTVAKTEYIKINDNFDELVSVIEKGSVITQDAGLKMFAVIAGKLPETRTKILNFVLQIIRNCKPRDVYKYSVDFFQFATNEEMKKFVEAIEEIKPLMNENQKKKIERLFK